MTARRIGLTGGIGSGKSTVGAMFAELGVPVLDLDRVGRDVLESGSDGLLQIVAVFGAEMLNVDGSLNRKRLAAHCFADTGETKKLNSIVHPLIWQAEEKWLSVQDTDFAIIEASVLLESGGVARMDAVVVVLADEALRRQRVEARGGDIDFDAVVQRQCSDTERRAAADFIINNNASLEDLRMQVNAIHRQLQKFER